MTMDECIFVRQACWIHMEMGESLDIYLKFGSEVIYQVCGRLMYVRGFQLISGIQHAILQIWVCVRKGYANESICEEWVWLDECVRRVDVGIRDKLMCSVVDVRSCICLEDYSQLDLLYDRHVWMEPTFIFTEEAHDHRISRLHKVSKSKDKTVVIVLFL